MRTFRAPARIPLFLRVVGKNPDDSPQMVSLKQTLDLCDQLTIGRSDSDRFQSLSPLVIETVNKYRQKSGNHFPVTIELDKKVPAKAGLGAQSSHAATVLWALNQLSDNPVDDEILQKWGAELNSEIPFYFSSGTAQCSGKGDEIQSMDPLPSKQVWIVGPQHDLPKKEIFKRLSLMDLQDRGLEETLERHINGQPECFNDFEEAAIALNPKLALLKQQIMDKGFRTVVMAGTGPTLFCLDGPGKNFPDDQFLVTHYLNRKKGSWY